MSGKTRLPHKIECLELESGKYYPIDSNGFECVIKAEGTAVLVSLKDGAERSEQFNMKIGDTFEFTGKIYVSLNSTTTTTSRVNVLYYKSI